MKAAVFLIAVSLAGAASVSYQVNVVESNEKPQPADFQVAKQVDNVVPILEPVVEGLHRGVHLKSSEDNRESTHQVSLHHDTQTQTADTPDSGYRGETTRAFHATQVSTEQYRDPLDGPRGPVIPQTLVHVQQQRPISPYAGYAFYKSEPVILETPGKLPSLPALAYSSVVPVDAQALTYGHDTWYHGRASLRQSMQTPHTRYVYGHFL